MSSPYAPQTDKLTVFAQAVIDRLQANSETLTDDDGNPLQVYYGEQTRYPSTPAAAVEPVDKERELQGSPRMYVNELQVVIIVYLTKVLESEQVIRKSVDELAERIEDILHQNPRYGDIVMDSHVRRSESGYAYKSGTQYRACRLEFVGLSKKGLPLPT